MKEIELIGEKDFTKELREAVDLDVKHLHFTNGADKPIWAKGILEGDSDLVKFGSLGGYGILRIEGKNNYKISGNSKEDPTVIYTKKPATPSLDIDGDGMNDSDFSAHTMSQRKYLRIEPNVNGFEAEDFTFRGDNNTPQWKPGWPEYESNFEFEHGNHNEGSNVTLRNIRSEYVRGDGFYGYGGNNVKIIDCSVHWCGRQGAAVVAGTNYLFKNYNAYRVRRSDLDIEPNGKDSIVNNIFLVGGSSYAYLSGVPMGGKGQVSNILIRDRDFQFGNSIQILGSHAHGYSRKNIIIDGAKFRAVSKGPQGAFKIVDAENILIENITDHAVAEDRSRIVAEIRGENKNIVIRNCDLKNGKYIALRDGAKPEDVTVYGVKQELEFQYEDGTTEPVVQEEGDSSKIPFEVSPELYNAYHFEDYSFGEKVEEKEEDKIAPVFDPFESIYVEVEEGIKGQVVEIKPTATDNSNEAVYVHQVGGIKSGQVFPVGVHHLTFRATDTSGNTAKKVITVTIEEKKVVDVLPPEFEPIENKVFEIEHDAEGRVVNFTPIAIDDIDTDVEIVQTIGKPSGSLFEEGLHRIMFRAIDDAGNFTEMEFTIEVKKKEKPIDPKPKPEPAPEPIPEPEEKPIESEQEALDMAQKILDFLKKKSSKIGIVVLIAIIITLILIL